MKPLLDADPSFSDLAVPCGRRARLDSDMTGRAFLLPFTLVLHARLAPFPRLQILTLSRESSHCGLVLLRYLGYPGAPFVL